MFKDPDLKLGEKPIKAEGDDLFTRCNDGLLLWFVFKPISWINKKREFSRSLFCFQQTDQSLSTGHNRRALVKQGQKHVDLPEDGKYGIGS